MKKYSMKDIAELSGVSVATVSRVINNNGRFSEETRKKVENIIEETGYRPNSSAKTLRMNKSFTIGVLVPDITNHFFAELLQKIEEILFDKGYATFICNTNRDREKEDAYLRMLESKGVDGLIIISGADEFGFDYNVNAKRKIPYICIDREPKNNLETIFISSNHYKGAIEATSELIQSGDESPMIVMPFRQSPASRERLIGFKDALKQNGLSFDKEINQLTIDADDQQFEQTLLNHLQSNPGIKGIFAAHDRIAIRILSTLKKINIDVPSQMRVIGFDNTPLSQLTSPSLSSVKHDTDEIAKTAVEKIIGLTIRPELDLGKTFLIPVSLEHRESSKIV